MFGYCPANLYDKNRLSLEYLYKVVLLEELKLEYL